MKRYIVSFLILGLLAAGMGCGGDSEGDKGGGDKGKGGKKEDKGSSAKECPKEIIPKYEAFVKKLDEELKKGTAKKFKKECDQFVQDNKQYDGCTLNNTPFVNLEPIKLICDIL